VAKAKSRASYRESFIAEIEVGTLKDWVENCIKKEGLS
jgi:hypothetical protein